MIFAIKYETLKYAAKGFFETVENVYNVLF